MVEGVGPAREHRVAVDESVALRVLEWPGPPAAGPLVVVAGWVSVVEGWAPLLSAFAGRRPLYYVETREKGSAELARGERRIESYDLAVQGRDLAAVLEALAIDPGRTVLFGSSMGANIVLEALKGRRLDARAAFLVGPNAAFRFPWWGRLMIRLPAACWLVVRPFLLWYLGRFRVDVEREPEQMARYERTLTAADPLRLKLSARAVSGYEAWPGLDSIATPVAVAYAESDTLHGVAAVERLVAAIPGARAIVYPSNRAMHSAGVAADIEAFESEASPGR